MMKLYIAGPMTGIKDFNYPAFEFARTQLEEAGYEILCPTDVEEPDQVAGDKPWIWYMRRTLRQVTEADAVAVLPNAACSKGSRVEMHVAQALEMEIDTVANWLAKV